MQTRQSVTGYVVYLEDAPTIHRSAMQKRVALSSSEAELNQAAQKTTLELIGLKVELTMILEMDNKGAVNLIDSFSVGGCMRHINVKQCFL